MIQHYRNPSSGEYFGLLYLPKICPKPNFQWFCINFQELHLNCSEIQNTRALSVIFQIF